MISTPRLVSRYAHGSAHAHSASAADEGTAYSTFLREQVSKCLLLAIGPAWNRPVHACQPVDQLRALHVVLPPVLRAQLHAAGVALVCLEVRGEKEMTPVEHGGGEDLADKNIIFQVFSYFNIKMSSCNVSHSFSSCRFQPFLAVYIACMCRAWS